MKKHLIIVSVIGVTLSAILAYLSLRYDLIPYPYSAEREVIDNFVKVLFSIASVFFSLIIVVFAYSLIVFRRKRGDTGEGRPIRGYSPLELAWTIIPLVIVLVLAVFGGIALNNITRAGPPGSEMEIDVTAQRYSWQFYYPAYNLNSFELHVPVNQRLVIRLQSKDVVHSFWVQEWGPKQDAVPGLTTQVRYTPKQTGQFMVECSQMCGIGHTYMTAPVFVTSADDFQGWVQQAQKIAATATPTATAPTGTSPAGATPPGINLVAKDTAFNMNTISVPAGAMVTINFDNQDPGMPHNFSVYTDSSATKSIFIGKVVTGPNSTQYMFTAPATPGNYFFRCDVHPTIMTGTLEVK